MGPLTNQDMTLGGSSRYHEEARQSAQTAIAVFRVIPFLGPTSQIVEGFRNGDAGQIALGILGLGLDVLAFGPAGRGAGGASNGLIQVDRAASTRFQTLLRNSGQLAVHNATHRAVVNEAVGLGWRGDVVVLRGAPFEGTAAGIATLNGRATLYIYEGAFTNGFTRGGVQLTGRALVAHELGHEIVTAAQAAGRTIGSVTPQTVYLGSGRHFIEAEASRAAAALPGLTQAERAALLQDAANQVRLGEFLGRFGP